LRKHFYKECGTLFLTMDAKAMDVIKAEIPEVATVATKDVKASQTATTGGRKFDGGKPRYGLLPPLAMKATAEVLTFGAEKYEPDNWKRVPESKTRYFDALERHVWAWKMGEQTDPESGMHHLAHALCCLMFLYEHDVKYSLDKK
jgi:hypothetical protein